MRCTAPGAQLISHVDRKGCRACAGALCEIVNPEDGSMSRTPQLLEFAARHGLRCVTIAELVRYRLQHDGYQAQASSNGNGAARQ